MNSAISLDKSILQKYQAVDEELVNKNLHRELRALAKKIIVLDDDPTGVQTVQNITVYNDWSLESLRDGFKQPGRMFFILTNSRSFTAEETTIAHRDIARNILSVSRETAIDFILISRSDSTLRGHYPLETAVLREALETGNGPKIDGEIIMPFFKEGGRFTIDNIHYVLDGSRLIPAGETEFARDKTFFYRSSHLGDWCEEKTSGQFKKADLVYISLATLRALDYDALLKSLCLAKKFNKIVVNAVDYSDVKVFVTALLQAISQGKRYIIRSAASLTKIIGGVPDRPLLTRNELIMRGNKNGGLIVVGSHVNKTSEQLAELMRSRKEIVFIEFHQRLVVEAKLIKLEIERVVDLAEQNIRCGTTVVIFTSRERFDLNIGDKEAELKMAAAISDAVTGIVARLKVRPNFIIAKGGITSSDIGTKALAVKKAMVMGQIKPGIPVWMTGAESKFPGLPYVIFPGNVGTKTTLREVVEILMGINES